MSRNEKDKLKKLVKKLECAILALDTVNTTETDAAGQVLREVLFDLDLMAEAEE